MAAREEAIIETTILKAPATLEVGVIVGLDPRMTRADALSYPERAAVRFTQGAS